MPIESLAVLIVEPGRAKLSRFDVELRGETLWMTGEAEVADRLSGIRPELVAVTGKPETAAELADQLRRRGLAQSVFLITPAGDGEPTEPGQVRVVLPEGAAATSPEVLVRHLLGAVLSAYARTPVSPLTGLPGSAVLRQEVDKRLSAHAEFIFLYLDIDNFKAYNDAYGFGRGDIAIRQLGKEVVAATAELGQPDDLCVHIGGDDFAVLTTSDKYAQLSEKVIAGFREHVPALYPEEAREQGYIETVSRRGEPARYPLMTISIGGVNTATRRVSSYLELSEIAAEVKRHAKELDGSQFVMDRRRD